ncbi:hypothetical protein [Streptomyces erythrochromogenes]|uniref:hypothetical protein n=1 Tax=Streptomyces erythrochromogenes TaxID=285574 RepID=UPI00369EE7A8
MLPCSEEPPADRIIGAGDTATAHFGPRLWRWLQDGVHFFVCGEADRMAKDVDRAMQALRPGRLPRPQPADRS